MHDKSGIRIGIVAFLLLASIMLVSGIAPALAAGEDAAAPPREEATTQPQAPSALAPGLQKPRPAWNEDDPYLRSLIDPFESNAARDQRFGRENALTTPRVDPDF